MAVISGKEFSAFSVDDSAGTPRDLKDNIRTVEVTNSQNLQDVTPVDAAWVRRLGLIKDMTMSVTSNVDPATGKSVDVFMSNSDNPRTVTFTVQGVTVTAEMLLGEWTFSRGDDAGLSLSISMSLESGTPVIS